MAFRIRRPPKGVDAPNPEGTVVVEVPIEPEGSPSPTLRSDETLARLAQQGDLDAFNELVARHERTMFNTALRLLRDVAAAEDATQDAFIRAWTNIHQFRGGEVRPWMARIVTNRCYDVLRTKSRRPTDSLDAELVEVEPRWSSQSSDESPESLALRRELSIHLERALHALPDDQRVVVLLSDVQGLSYQEVADATDAALGTVKSRLSRARGKLRDVLSTEPETMELFLRYLRLESGEGDGSSAEELLTDLLGSGSEGQ